MSHFTLGVVNVEGGECRGGECRTIVIIAITAGKHRLVSRPDALFPLVSIIRKAEGQPAVKKQQQAHHL